MSESERAGGVFLSPTAAAEADVVFVDVRDAWEYEGIGHLPGAVSIPFETFRSEDGDDGMLPGAERWEETLSAAGITPTDRLVAYDDTHGVFAARFLVTAELYGHEPTKLQLLDGDYSAWSRNHPVEQGVVEREQTDYEAGEPAESPLIDFDRVAEATDPDAKAVLVDTREPWEYEEGHLPGAVQVDWMTLVDTDGTRGLRPADECREILREHGIVPERRVILYCNTARRISHTYLVLRELGFDDVAFYEGSLTEWERRDGTLVAGSDPR